MIKFNITKNKNFYILILALLVLLIAFNLLFFLFLGDYNFDLTSDKRYSLSDKTINFLKNNNQKINIKFFVSKDLKSKNYKLAEYAEYLRKIFIEYKNNGKGLIDLSFVDVEPFENSQFEAEKYNIKEFNFNDGVKYQYLGAIFSSIDGGFQSISQFYPERKSYVEDDITRLLSIILKKRKPELGVVSPFFDVIDEKNFIKHNFNWPFINNLEKFGYNIVPIQSTTMYIDKNIDVVLLFYPMNLSTSLIYALDQYLVNGGNLVIMMDAFSEERFRSLDNYYNYQSGILDFLKKHGVLYNENLVVGDNLSSRTVIMDNKNIKYPFKINITKNMFAKHPINENINVVYYNHGGFFEYQKQDNLVNTVIAKTSDSSGFIVADKITDLGYDELLRYYVYSEKSYVLSLLLEGKFSSYYNYFPFENEKLIEKVPMFVSSSEKNGKLLLIGDADIVNEIMWNANVGIKKGIYDIAYSSDNLLFLRNIFDYMSDSQYVSVGGKFIEKNGINLFDIFQKLAIEYYNDYYQETLNNLADVKEKIFSLENNNTFEMFSIKKSKEKELLMRKKTAANLNLKRISYLIEEKYNFYRACFSIFVIFVLPILACIIVWVIYELYNRKLMKKAKEHINE